jgi:TolA-binding protein
MSQRRWMVLSLILVLPALGCDKLAGLKSTSGDSSATPSASTESQAEKTRRIEEKAAEIERKAEEIRNMQGTDQEKIDAMNALERERQELMRMQEDSGGSNPY